MGTKTNPGPFDCYASAAPDEPIFILRAVDPAAPDAIEDWCDIRSKMIRHGTKPDSDWQMIFEARAVADQMRDWRRSSRRGTVPLHPLPAAPMPFDPVRFTNLLTRARAVIGDALRADLDSFRYRDQTDEEVLADAAHPQDEDAFYAEMNAKAQLLAEIDAALNPSTAVAGEGGAGFAATGEGSDGR